MEYTTMKPENITSV